MPESRHPNSSQGPSSERSLSLPEVMGSVLAAAFGVQSRENKVRDFTRGKPGHFILTGVLFTLALLLALVAIVTAVV